MESWVQQEVDEKNVVRLLSKCQIEGVIVHEEGISFRLNDGQMLLLTDGLDEYSRRWVLTWGHKDLSSPQPG